jgi:hypothetical protein
VAISQPRAARAAGAVAAGRRVDYKVDRRRSAHRFLADFELQDERLSVEPTLLRVGWYTSGHALCWCAERRGRTVPTSMGRQWSTPPNRTVQGW